MRATNCLERFDIDSAACVQLNADAFCYYYKLVVSPAGHGAKSSRSNNTLPAVSRDPESAKLSASS